MNVSNVFGKDILKEYVKGKNAFESKECYRRPNIWKMCLECFEIWMIYF